MATLMVIKRNAGYEKGMYGYSLHDPATGGAGNVTPVKDEKELRAVLLEFGRTEEYADDVIERLRENHDSVKLDLDKKTIAGLETWVP